MAGSQRFDQVDMTLAGGHGSNAEQTDRWRTLRRFILRQRWKARPRPGLDPIGARQHDGDSVGSHSVFRQGRGGGGAGHHDGADEGQRGPLRFAQGGRLIGRQAAFKGQG
jgi:hypothetical protein